MSKSILVIDTPENCNEYELRTLTECDYDKEFYCVANGENVEEFVCSKTKPDWCPIRDLPVKKEENKYHNDYERGIVDGFNAYIDELLEGGETE